MLLGRLVCRGILPAALAPERHGRDLARFPKIPLALGVVQTGQNLHPPISRRKSTEIEIEIEIEIP